VRAEWIDYFARLRWLYGDPMRRMFGQRADVIAWHQLGQPKPR